MSELWQTLLCDAHAHLGTEAERREREEGQILSLLCATTPEEARLLLPLAARHNHLLIPTCGIHPWQAESYLLKDMAPWIKLCPVLGEIGMDSVWCQVPLSLQEHLFRMQLDLACHQKKPVILHTKGQEAAVARIIRDYPNRYLVHWYSCQEYLEQYLELDCYFSVGPDVWWNPAVRHVARTVPLTRLLTETDGLAAVAWAEQEGAAAQIKAAKKGKNRKRQSTVAASLSQTLKTIADIRGISLEKAGRQIRENLLFSFLPSLSGNRS